MSADLTSADQGAVLNALGDTVLVLDERDRLAYVNQAGEQFFQFSAAQLAGMALAKLVPDDSPVHGLVARCRASGRAVAAYRLTITTQRRGENLVDVQAAPMGEGDDRVVLTLHAGAAAERLNRQLSHRNAARSVTAIARTLAHEVKNPMSGVRGAAQLLEQTVPENDQQLTRVIRDEADRVVSLIQRMEAFSNETPPQREAVNLHAALDHARRVAENGFAGHVDFRLAYDPSLPAAHANRDQLIQIFINLIKNAAEVLEPYENPTITLATAYQHGLRLAAHTAAGRRDLPLSVTISDNGPGIPGEMQRHLFDAFVTDKPGGTGLGLALVAKIVNEHGGLIDCQSDSRGTAFHISLPVAEAAGVVPAAPTGDDDAGGPV